MRLEKDRGEIKDKRRIEFKDTTKKKIIRRC